MANPEVTILMAPRERYSGILPCIESLYEHTQEVPFRLVYVDGALPDSIRRAVEAEAQQRGFTFIHKPYPLTPNEARNIGLQNADTRLVVFSDNDVLFLPNWLPPLLAAEEEFGAWLVGPTILDGDPAEGKIHAASADSGFSEVNGERHYHMIPRHMQKKLADVTDSLERGPSTMLEFHVLLARRELFDAIGPLDEKISSMGDHDDLVHMSAAAGGPVIYEPASVVSYHDPGTNITVLEPIDMPMYYLRWSDAWNLPSIERMVEKWEMDPNDPWIPHAKDWVRLRRRRALRRGGLPAKAISFALYRLSKPLGAKLERLYCSYFTRSLEALRAKA